VINDLQLLEGPAASDLRPTESPQAPSAKRRPPLTSSETATIRELAARGLSSSEIARQLDDRPVRTVRETMRAMGFAKPSVAPPASSATVPKQPPKPSYVPFTAADKVRIENLARSGVATAEIAKRVGRGLPQVSKVVRELTASTKQPTSVPLALNVPAKTMAALAAAARRRNVEPARLLVEIADGVLRRGSVDAVIHTDAELVDDLRTISLVLNLEAVGRANGDAASRDYRLKAVALAHSEHAR
jgi:hypothetical protein